MVNKGANEGALKPEGVLAMGPADPERKGAGKGVPNRVDSKAVLTLPGLIVREEQWDYSGTIRKRPDVYIAKNVGEEFGEVVRA